MGRVMQALCGGKGGFAKQKGNGSFAIMMGMSWRHGIAWKTRIDDPRGVFLFFLREEKEKGNQKHNLCFMIW